LNPICTARRKSNFGTEAAKQQQKQQKQQQQQQQQQQHCVCLRHTTYHSEASFSEFLHQTKAMPWEL
jgi:hypothetical protein